jgi:hypothetical protein
VNGYQYKKGRLIPFIGAGASMSVQWMEHGQPKRGPSWGELVDEAIKSLGFTDPRLLRVRGTDLQILEYFKLKNHNQTTKLNYFLHSSLTPPDDALKASPIHKGLAQLDKCHLFYTTNYDDFLERSFKLLGRSAKAVAIEAHMGGQPNTCEIIKFHGDLLYPDTMVLSESDYEERLNLNTAMDFRLSADLLGRALLFIGYSFRDWNVSYLFRTINNRFDALPGSTSGRRAYIVVPDPSDFEIQLFRARNIEVIPIDGAQMTDDIALLLSEIRG